MTKSIPSKTLGFTLTELLMTLAVMGIVLSLSIPSMTNLINSNRLTTQANSLVGALNIARSESAKRNKVLTVRKNNAGWQSGWQVFIDEDQDGVFDVDDDTNISQNEAVKNSTMEVTNTFTNYISFRPDGRSNATGSFYFCSPSAIEAFRRVVVSGSGRIRTETQDSSSKTYADECQ